MKSRLIGKDPDAGKDGGQEDKGVTGDEMVGWHPWLNGDEFAQALGDCEGQGNLVCCSPWGRKKLDTTELLNNNNNKDTAFYILALFAKRWEALILGSNKL